MINIIKLAELNEELINLNKKYKAYESVFEALKPLVKKAIGEGDFSTAIVYENILSFIVDKESELASEVLELRREVTSL